MSVEFDGDNYGGFNGQVSGQTVGTIERLVIKTGLAPDPRRARMVLAVIFLVFIVVSIFFFVSLYRSSSQSSVSRDAIMQSLEKTQNSLPN